MVFVILLIAIALQQCVILCQTFFLIYLVLMLSDNDIDPDHCRKAVSAQLKESLGFTIPDRHHVVLCVDPASNEHTPLEIIAFKAFGSTISEVILTENRYKFSSHWEQVDAVHNIISRIRSMRGLEDIAILLVVTGSDAPHFLYSFNDIKDLRSVKYQGKVPMICSCAGRYDSITATV
jgi:hypothetical protein